MNQWTFFAPRDDFADGTDIGIQNHIVTYGSFSPETLATLTEITSNNGITYAVDVIGGVLD